MQLKLVYSNGSTTSGARIDNSWPNSGPAINTSKASSTMPWPSSAPCMDTSKPPWEIQVQYIKEMLTTIGPVHPDGVTLVARQVVELFMRTIERVAGLQLHAADDDAGYGHPKRRVARAVLRPILKPKPSVSAPGTGLNRRSDRHQK